MCSVLRSRMSAVLTGIDTVLADDPQLNVRDPAIDMLGSPAAARRARQQPAHAAGCAHAEPAGRDVDLYRLRLQSLTQRTTAAAAPAPRWSRSSWIATGRIDLNSVLQELGRRMCNDVLVEAGPTLVGRILQLGLADEVVVYVAPVLLGPDARAMAGLPSLMRLDQAQRYTLHTVDRIGDDVRLVLRRP